MITRFRSAFWLLFGYSIITAACATGPSPGGSLGRTVIVNAQDEFAEIDNARSLALLKLIQSADATTREAALKKAVSDPNAYVPSILFEISKDLYARGQSEDATYWYSLARLRMLNDSDILVDTTAQSGLLTLVQTYGSGFSEYAPGHWDVVWQQLNRAVEWDRTNPPAYDRRWLALHGIRAIQSALPSPDGVTREKQEITIPVSEWAERDEMNRQDMLAKLKVHVDRSASSPAVEAAND
jgi:hypothetical protein